MNENATVIYNDPIENMVHWLLEQKLTPLQTLGTLNNNNIPAIRYNLFSEEEQ